MATECTLCGHTEQPPSPEPTEELPAHSPQFQALLNSNVVPEDKYYLELQSALAEDINLRDQLDAEMAEFRQKMRTELLRMMTRRRRTNAMIRDRKHVLNPVRRLPDDVLREIFTSCLPHQQDWMETSSLNQAHMPWVLSRVCARWRTIAISYQRLWSTVTLTQKELESASLRRMLLILGVQLSRCPTYSLRLSIWVTDNADLEDSELPPILSALAPSSPRWTELFLYMPLQSFRWLAALSAFPLSIEKLTLLPFSRGQPWYAVQDIQGSPLTNDLPPLPKLKTLCAVSIGIADLPISHQNIEAFVVSRGDIERSRIPGVLSSLPNLKRCSVRVRAGETPQDSTSSPPITMHHLTVLKIENRSDGSTSWLDHLHLPSLRHWHLFIDKFDDPKTVVQLLQRSKPPLETLEILSASMTDEECIDILEVAPTLTFLSLHCPEAITQIFWDRLLGTDAKVFMVPDLRFLDVGAKLPADPPLVFPVEASSSPVSCSR